MDAKILVRVRTFEHQQCNVNLQKGDTMVMRLPHSPMVKSTQNGEEETESFTQLELT